MKLLTESQLDNIKYDTEICEKTNSKKMYVTGVTLQGNIKNRNGRIYPNDVLDDAVLKHVQEAKDLGMTLEGELKHPEKSSHEVNEDRISHRFVEVNKDGDNWITKALILETDQGKQVRNLIEGGVKLGISSRCIGSIKSSNGVDVVQPGLKVITMGDIIRRPSAPDALIDAIYEKKEYVYENGVLVEKDLSEDLDSYKKLIDKTNKKDRAVVFEKIILDYFNKIGIS